MSKTIREQFEEIIRISNSRDRSIISSPNYIAEKCESIADTQSIEFAKWIVLNKWTRTSELECWYQEEVRGKWSSEYLLAQFKQEHYKQKI